MCTRALGYPDLPLNRITAIMGELVSPHQHTHTHKHTAHHDGSLGRLIRNARESVCMCLCFYMCVWKSLMARIRLLTLCVSERRIKQDKNTLTHTDTHIQREALLLRLNLTLLLTTFINDCKFYSNTADTWGQGKKICSSNKQIADFSNH